jgi:hypothetical protein
LKVQGERLKFRCQMWSVFYTIINVSVLILLTTQSVGYLLCFVIERIRVQISASTASKVWYPG